ncbi:acyl carrier protein [Streptomyces sp. CB04723]|uniref:phosphopantetheine-binding protein n=1 Tax=Streptomyces TaxID=1883 RepID=UPI0015C4BD7A|nr:phosphopantetheine-binding protein [Streptomyces sp. CB04723]QLG30230.1 acyl carrier protein [Streptomyces sp. CB04723]
MEDTAVTTPGPTERVRKVLFSVLGGSVDASAVGPDTDLWESGLDSLLSVSPMAALEDEFDVEFPDEMLTRQTFSSVRRISDGTATLVAK